MDYFSSRGFWCVAMDLRGYNDSEKPKGIKSYAMEYLVSDVKDVIEGLGVESCILVGHDWGGAIGYAFVAKWPSMVKKYIGWISEYINRIQFLPKILEVPKFLMLSHYQKILPSTVLSRSLLW